MGPDSWKYEKGGKIFWQWRHAYRKLLNSIAENREPQKRLHNSSDQQIVDILKKDVKRCQLWIDEMRNPVEVVA